MTTTIFAYGHAVFFGGIQFIAFITLTGSIQIASAIGTAQRTCGYTVSFVILHKFAKTTTNTSSQAIAIFLTFVTAIGHTYIPIPVIALVALTANFNQIEIRIFGAIASNLYMFFVLKENRSKNSYIYIKLITQMNLMHLNLTALHENTLVDVVYYVRAKISPDCDLESLLLWL